MKIIPLTQGQFAIVDDADFEWANQWKWYAQQTQPRRFYAARRVGTKILLLHRELLAAPPEVEVDHWNGNSLNCKRENLRPATSQQNSQNARKTRSLTTSRFKGVCRVSSRCNATNPWLAYIGGSLGKIKRIYLGYHESEEQAARAYDERAKELFGKFACLNFPNE